MSNYANGENKRILKTSVLSFAAFVMFVLFAVLFAEISDSYRKQEIFATAEATAEVTPGNGSEDGDSDVTDEPVSSPGETTKPSDGEKETEKPEPTKSPEHSDNGDSETKEPDTAVPEDTGVTDDPDNTDSTDVADGTENPETTGTGEPENTDSASPEISKTPVIITPSPTLPELEEPFVSGNVVIDVEEGKQTSSNIPQKTSGSADVMNDDFLELTPTPIGSVKTSGSLAAFFDVMVYVFIGCAVLTAGYGVFIGIKLFMKKKKEKGTKNE